jgi:hypothetical protein
MGREESESNPLDWRVVRARLSEQTAPFDALVHFLDAEAGKDNAGGGKAESSQD